jgi:predicted SprT family Zn-dependent metalloprotease
MSDDPTSEPPSLRVVGGTEASPTTTGARSRAYVCTWCASRFTSRGELDAHKMTSAECRANQKVSSPLQTRYGDADMVWTQPGEATLHRVRAATCGHTHARARLVNAAGQTIGYQCGWCYGVLPDDLA